MWIGWQERWRFGVGRTDVVGFDTGQEVRAMPIRAFDESQRQSSVLAVQLSDQGFDDDGPARRARPDHPVESGSGRLDLRGFTRLNPGLRHGVASPALAERAELIDLTLTLTPMLEDTHAWSVLHAGSFTEDWRDLPGTIQSDLGYLAVSLAPPAVAQVEAVLHLAVPAGIPAAHLPPAGDGAAPTLLLARGLALQVHDARRQGGAWQVHAEVLPAGNWGRQRDRSTPRRADAQPAAGGR
jgi:hypothetical protein